MAQITDDSSRRGRASRGLGEGHARHDPGAGRSWDRRCAARQPPPRRRPPVRRRRLLAGGRSRPRPRAARAGAAGRGPRPRGGTARACPHAGEVGRSKAADGGRRLLEALLAHLDAGGALGRLRGRGARGARAADDEAARRRGERAGAASISHSSSRCRSCRRTRRQPFATGRRLSTRSSGGCATRSTSSRSSPAATTRRARGRYGVARRRSRRPARSTPTSRAASSGAR